MSEMTSRQRQIERTARDASQVYADFVSKSDMDVFKDRVQILVAESVSASVSIWQDRADCQMRLLEKELAAVRIGIMSCPQPGAAT